VKRGPTKTAWLSPGLPRGPRSIATLTTRRRPGGLPSRATPRAVGTSTHVRRPPSRRAGALLRLDVLEEDVDGVGPTFRAREDSHRTVTPTSARPASPPPPSCRDPLGGPPRSCSPPSPSLARKPRRARGQQSPGPRWAARSGARTSPRASSHRRSAPRGPQRLPHYRGPGSRTRGVLPWIRAR
jgi:hypothetical protein